MHVRIHRSEGGENLQADCMAEWVMLEAVVKDDEWNTISPDRCIYEWRRDGDILAPNMSAPNMYRICKHTGLKGHYSCTVKVGD